MSLDAQQLESVPSYKCSILSHTFLTHKLHNIRISKPKDFVYQAGQYIKLYLNDGTYRLYSIANAPHQPHIELHIQEPNHDNFLKSFLHTLTIDQDLFISDAMGKLVLPSHIEHPTLLIAGGYAFAPFKAILEDLYIKKDVNSPVYLYWGLSKTSDIYHYDELKKIKNSTNWFDFQIILSNPEDGWEGKIGNLASFIFSDFNNLEDFTLYVCGSMNMVEDIYHKALQNNLTQSNFYSDYDLKS
jgi:CDP-4-dehydro-6-deoxyglucose reductase